MGIVINIVLSKSLTQEEWEPVYEETVKLAEVFPLVEIREEEIHGILTNCLAPTKERTYTYRRRGRKEKTYKGWSAVGDYVTMKTAEDHMLVRNMVDDAKVNPNAGDAMRLFLPSRLPNDFEYDDKEYDRQWHYLWDAKTQGEPYHILLLAIACTIQARLGKKAYIEGNITLGQCRKAVEIANEVLDEPILMPEQCDLNRFYERVDRLPFEELLKYKVFQELYLGAKNAEFGNFVREKYSAGTLMEYWKERFQSRKIGSTGYHRVMKDFMLSGYSLRELCEVVDFSEGKDIGGKKKKKGKNAEQNEKEPRKSVYDRFVKSILDAKLHQKEKNTIDYLEVPPEEEHPYGVTALFAQTLLGGLIRNKKIDRYIPLEEIRETLQECIGDKCSVDALLDEYVAKEAAEEAISYDKIMGEEGEDKSARDERLKCAVHQDAYEVLIQSMESRMDVEQKEQENYDIKEWENLLDYQAGNRILPEMYEQLEDWLSFYHEVSEENDCKSLRERSAKDRCSYLAQNSNILIRDSDWEKIFDEVENTPASLDRYYPMTRIVIQTTGAKYIVTAMVINDDFFEFSREVAAKKGKLTGS